MEQESELIKCSFCAEFIKSEAILCRFCGKSVFLSGQISQQVQSLTKNSGLGLSISSLVLGVIGLTIGLVDYGGLSDGTYAYLNEQEIGLLAIINFTALGLGIGASVRKDRLWIGALIVSIFSVLVTLGVAAF